MKLSITRLVGFFLLVPTLGTFIILALFFSFLTRMDHSVHFSNLASKQRLISQQMGAYAHMVYEMDQVEQRGPLKKFVAVFDHSLNVLELGGEIDGIILQQPPPEIYGNLKEINQLWNDLKPSLLAVANQLSDDPQSRAAYDKVVSGIPILTQRSDDLVSRFAEWDKQQRFRAFYIIAALAGISFILLIVGVWATKRYVAEQKLTEQTLRVSEAKFRRVVEQSTDGIYVLQGNRFVFVNPKFTEITGYELEEISSEGFNYQQLVAEDGKKVLAKRADMRERGEEPPSHYVFKGLRKDGREVDLEVNVITVEWELAPATLGTVRDVSNRIRSQKELEKALQRAEQSDRLKSLFLANMSHEIRTPLNSILGFTDIIENEVGQSMTPEVQNYFNIIRDGGNRLMRTVHEILDISQIETGGFTIDPRPLDLVKLIEMIVEEYQPVANVKRLKMTFSTQMKAAVINADEYSIKQAYANLIDNALKFTAEGNINISVEADGDKVIVTISDTGIGISDEYLGSIFEAFSQESIGYARKYEGVGLGLALTKRYLEMNNATLDVYSQKDMGTTFTLAFTLYPVKEEHEPVINSEVIPDTRKKKKPLILLVEDDSHSKQLMAVLLKGNYDIVMAISVEDAKKQLEQNPVDGILLDLSLQGGEDGLALARFLRQSKDWKDLPIIALTAHAFTTDRGNCMEAGCNDYLTKPVTKKRLLETIRMYL